MGTNNLGFPTMGFLYSDELFIVGFMDLDYPSEIVIHYLLIEGITCLGYWDYKPMVSVLVHVMHIR